MKNPLDTIFGGGDFLMCIQDWDGVLIYQNSRCLNTCGKLQKVPCDKLCSQWPKEGKQKNQPLALLGRVEQDKKTYDKYIIIDPSHITSFYISLEERFSEEMKGIKTVCSLTPREEEIIGLKIRGDSNITVANKLFISKSTLRTHLNNIYKRLPSLFEISWKKS